MALSNRRRIAQFATYGFALVALVGGALFIVPRWSEFVLVLGRTDPVLLALSIVPALVASGLAVGAWRLIWPGLGYEFSFRAATKMFFISQAGKYIPGSVWPVAAQAAMTSRWRIPARVSVVVGILALAVAIATGLLVGSLSFLGVSGEARREYWWVALLVIAMVVLLLPPVLQRVTALALRLTRREPIVLSGIGWRRQGVVSLVDALYWVAAGVHFWVILVALGADPMSTFLPAVAGFAISFCVGILFVPAPAGLGVREAALVIALAGTVGAADALAAALISRVILALIDFALAGVSYTTRLPEKSVRPVPASLRW